MSLPLPPAEAWERFRVHCRRLVFWSLDCRDRWVVSPPRCPDSAVPAHRGNTPQRKGSPLRSLHRVVIAACAGLATFTGAVVLGVGAQGGTTPKVSELLRAGPGSDTYQISADGGRTWSRQLPRPEKLHL